MLPPIKIQLLFQLTTRIVTIFIVTKIKVANSHRIGDFYFVEVVPPGIEPGHKDFQPYGIYPKYLIAQWVNNYIFYWCICFL